MKYLSNVFSSRFRSVIKFSFEVLLLCVYYLSHPSQCRVVYSEQRKSNARLQSCCNVSCSPALLLFIEHLWFFVTCVVHSIQYFH